MNEAVGVDKHPILVSVLHLTDTRNKQITVLIMLCEAMKVILKMKENQMLLLGLSLLGSVVNLLMFLASSSVVYFSFVNFLWIFGSLFISSLELSLSELCIILVFTFY